MAHYDAHLRCSGVQSRTYFKVLLSKVRQKYMHMNTRHA